MATIGLSIIAKDEVRVIERCLRSVAPICDYFIVNDTGSTDGTQDVVRAFFTREGLAGEVVETPWRDFAFNRTAALAEMRKYTNIDYCLMIDADEQLFYDEGFDPVTFKAGLSADYVNVRTELNGVIYLRPQLTRNAIPFSYRAALHEFLEVPGGHENSDIAHGVVNRPTPDGARSQNPRKYQDDAVLLWDILKHEEDPFLRSRYQFYLGQSLRDAGEMEAAVEAYLGRPPLGGWQEEVFVSYYEAAKLQERLGHPHDDVLANHLRAHDASPGRAESLVAAARLARHNARYATAYMLARRAMELRSPPTALFAEPWVYAYQAKDEAAVAAYWLGKYDECLRWSEELLASADLPEGDRPRVIANRDIAREKLKASSGEPVIGARARAAPVTRNEQAKRRSGKRR